jgi:hypothetical protein
MPQPTRPPVDEKGRRDLSRYVILYNVTNNEIPFTSDYIAVANLTDVFLREFFTELFSSVNFATLDYFETKFVNAEFRRNEPIAMQYNSTAFFDTDSASIPTSLDMNVLLKQAFLGPNGENYTEQLQDLNETNPFSTTTSVKQMTVSVGSTESGTQNTSRIIAATLGSVAAVASLFATGIFVRRKKMRSNRDDKSLVHGHFSFSAGDTLATPDETLALSTIAKIPEAQSPVQSVSYNKDEYSSVEDSATSTSGGEGPYRTQSFDSASSLETIDTDLPEYSLKYIRAVKLEPPKEKTSNVSGSDEEAPPQGETTNEGNGKVEEPHQEETTSAAGAEENHRERST